MCSAHNAHLPIPPRQLKQGSYLECMLTPHALHNNIMVVEQQILNLETEYKEKRQRLEGQKSVLVSKDLLHMNNIEKSHVPCQYCGSADH